MASSQMFSDTDDNFEQDISRTSERRRGERLDQGFATSPSEPRPVNLLAKAVAILSRREYSEVELRRKLSQYTEDQAQIDAVVERLQRENWQSDQRFAENFVISRQQRWGNQKILHALKNHQLTEETVSELKETLKETEFDRALEVWNRKFHGMLPTTPQERAKQIRFLASRGFSADVVRKILSRRD
ncbi:recombination regulator RecX [Pelistega europaea]|nr:recombination regulator RecX [Pelistega europaea]